MQPAELLIAAIGAPPRAWPDAAKVVRQIGVMNPASRDTVMRGLDAARRRVRRAVSEARDSAPDAPIYLDIEPGESGWVDPNVQAFAQELLGECPNAYLFPGAIFDSLIRSDPAAALRIASSASRGLLFPAYHGALSIAQHERVLRPRLERLAALGVPFALAVSRIYNDAVGPAQARTRVPLADFLRGVEVCRSCSRTIVLWSWGRDWEPRGEDELRTAMTVGDQELVVLSVC